MAAGIDYAFGGVKLSDLTNFMKNYPTMRIELGADFKKEIGLFKALKNQIDTEKFKAGTTQDMLIKAAGPYTGKAHAEDLDLPTPGTTSYAKATLSIYELIATAGVSKQAMDRGIGGTFSWGNVVQAALADLQIDFNTLLTIAAMGDGTGKLAKFNSACTATAGVFTTGCTFDNTAYSFGWDNTYMLREGMRVDVWDEAGTTQYVSKGVVSAIVRGNRANGVATTGSCTITAPLAAAGDPDDNGFVNVDNQTIPDNAVMYLYGSKTYSSGVTRFPMGLTGLISNGTAHGVPATFQGLTRASYPIFKSTVYRGSSYGGTDDTIGTWGLSDLSMALDAAIYGYGGSGPDVLLMNQAMANQISRMNKGELVYNVNGNLGNPTAVGDRYANAFMGPDGKLLPIIVDPNISANVIYGMCTNDFTCYNLGGGFDFLREYGEIWEPSRGNRKTNYEAPYGGYLQFGAWRCDNSFAMFDLANNMA